ncbi:hypothetical protein LguiB_028519 [Lonicera macranthoides]
MENGRENTGNTDEFYTATCYHIMESDKPNRTVKVSNLSLGATLEDIKEFFSFSGEIEYVEMESFNEWSQIAYVTFKDSQGAETGVLLSGATIVDFTVNIQLAPDYQLPPGASEPMVFSLSSCIPYLPTLTLEPENHPLAGADIVFRKAEDVVSTMIAKGFVLGKDAVNKAKALDKKHQLTSTASATVSSLNQKIGFTDKISAGTSMVNEKVREVDQKLQVSEKAKLAYTVAGEKVSTAGSAIMKNKYIFTGVSWATSAFSRVVKGAGDIGQNCNEKWGVNYNEMRGKMVDDYARVHLADDYEPSKQDQGQQQPKKPAAAQGLIL